MIWGWKLPGDCITAERYYDMPLWEKPLGLLIPDNV
jgi:hypothetical protein